MKEKIKRCENCRWHHWFNGWKCRLGCWEFRLFLPVDCDRYEDEDEDSGD